MKRRTKIILGVVLVLLGVLGQITKEPTPPARVLSAQEQAHKQSSRPKTAR